MWIIKTQPLKIFNQLLNHSYNLDFFNSQILHARTDYEDFPELDRKRHLLRLWLSTNEGWELPPVFAEKYGTVEQGKRRGGIYVPGMKLTVPFEAE